MPTPYRTQITDVKAGVKNDTNIPYFIVEYVRGGMIHAIDVEVLGVATLYHAAKDFLTEQYPQLLKKPIVTQRSKPKGDQSNA